MDKLIKPPYGGVFFTIDESGAVTDKGIYDEMLEKEAEIREDLIELGVIRNFTGKLMDGEPNKNFKKT